MRGAIESNCATVMRWYDGVRIPHRNAIHRRAGELRLDLEHGLRVRGGGGVAFAIELEHGRDVLLEFVADALHARVLRDVVVLLGQAQAALTRVRDDAIGVLEVRAGPDAERSQTVRLLQDRERRRQVGRRLDRGDPRHRRLDGLRAERFDRRGVEAGREKCADLELVRRRLGLAGLEVARRGLDDLAHDRLVLVLQLVERAPLAVLRGNRCVLEPPAVGERVEVGARRAGRVEIGAVERLWRRGLGGNGRGLLGGGRCHRKSARERPNK